METDTEKIKRYRQLLIASMQRRAPQSDVIEKMREEYGVPDYSLRSIKRGKYILCGRRVRACKKINVGAISMMKRGTGKKVSTPYDEPSSTCIGCGACVRVCSAGAIEIVETETSKIIWGKEVPKKPVQ